MKSAPSSQARQPKPGATECEGNNKRDDYPHGLRYGQNERNIDEPFSVHAASEDITNQEWKKGQREQAQREQDRLSHKEPARQP
jgi:hypothetical protein